MKKIFGFIAVVVMVAAANVKMSSNNNEELTALQLENIEYLAEAEINPDCPNGCHKNGSGCHCFNDYDNLREHNWGD